MLAVALIFSFSSAVNFLSLQVFESLEEPLEVFKTAIAEASPMLEVKPKRIGGATYQVPMEVRGDRKLALAFRWIIEGARNKKGKAMDQRLAQELIE